jgi:hypothetical protein
MKPLRTAGLAAGIVVAAAAAGTVWVAAATTPTPASSTPAEPPAICTNFLGHLASDLNTSQANLSAAFQKAIGQTLDDQVKAGKLSQTRADAIKQRLAARTPCALVDAGKLKGARNLLQAFRAAYLDAAATSLGLTTDQLKADLAKGMSLAQVAAAQHVTEAQFRAGLVKNLTPVLDKAVADKKLTSAQEQKLLKRIGSGPLPMWNRPAKPATTSAGTGG